MISQREKEIQNIVRSIYDLNEIFKDLAVMIIDQVRQVKSVKFPSIAEFFCIICCYETASFMQRVICEYLQFTLQACPLICIDDRHLSVSYLSMYWLRTRAMILFQRKLGKALVPTKFMSAKSTYDQDCLTCSSRQIVQL